MSFNVGGHTANVNAQLINFSIDGTQLATAGNPDSKALYVDMNRTSVDTPVGSQLLPFVTIMDAVNQVVANGDNSTFTYTIYIAPGTYLETINLSNPALVNLIFIGSGTANISGVIVGGYSTGIPAIEAINNDNLNVVFVDMVFIPGNGADHGIEFSSTTQGTQLGRFGIIFRSCGIRGTVDVYLNNVVFVQFDDTGITPNVNATNVDSLQFMNGNGPNPQTPVAITTNAGSPTPYDWTGSTNAVFIGCGVGSITCDAGSTFQVESCSVSGDITTSSTSASVIGSSFIVGNVVVNASGELGLLSCFIGQPNSGPATSITVNGILLSALTFITGTQIAVNSGALFVEDGAVHDTGTLTVNSGGTYQSEGDMGIGNLYLSQHLNNTPGNPDVAGTQTINSGTEVSFTFENAFTDAPVVVVTPQGDTTSIGAWWVTTTATGFSIFMKNSGTMTFNYVVVGNPS